MPEMQINATFAQWLHIPHGVSQGVELGLRKMLVSFLKIHPEWTDQQIATFFDVPLVLVTTVRKEQEQLEANKQ